MTMLCLTIILTLWAATAWANCITLTISAWTPDQRTYLRDVASAAAREPVNGQWVTGQVGTLVELCAPTADVSGLQAAALQTAAQALHQARVDADAATAAAATEAVTELDGSQFCRTATLQQIEDRLDTQHDAIQVDIDAIDTTQTIPKIKTALTTMNNRRTAIDKGTIRCLVSYMRYQQLQGLQQ